VLDAAQDLCRALSTTSALPLRELGTTLAARLGTLEAQELRAQSRRTSTLAREAFDQVARGQAKDLLADLVDALVTIDAMWSLAVSTVEHDWSYPRPGARLRVTGLRHPFLGQRAVANDLELDDRVRICFVTGPNMAGKSTFLKAMALSLLLAHVGCGVPAEEMEFVPVATLFSSVQIIDNLSAGESFYLAEVRRIRALAIALREHGSVAAVVDEPFRGTNVHDAAEATLAVITRLANHPHATVFIASHLAEIVPALADDPRVRLLQFTADLNSGEPCFDYRLRPGLSTQRLGMTLLKQEQVLDLLEQASRGSGTGGTG